MGHSCVETAQKYYIQASDKALERSIKLTELTDDEYDSFLEKTHSMLGHNSKNR